jgi:hypothetical protein
MRGLARILLTIVLATLAWGAAAAHADTSLCSNVVAEVPTTITTPGVWCLTTDLSYTGFGTAIVIAVDDVVLEMNDHTLACVVPPSRRACETGIWAYDRTNVTVKNGTVRGFPIAVSLNTSDFGPARYRIEAITAVASYIGLFVGGSDSIVRGCRVSGTTQVGIEIGRSVATSVIDNDVRNYTGIGIFMEGSLQNAAVLSNRLAKGDFGIYFHQTATGKYRDNLTAGVTTKYVGGTDVGNNQ